MILSLLIKSINEERTRAFAHVPFNQIRFISLYSAGGCSLHCFVNDHTYDPPPLGVEVNLLSHLLSPKTGENRPDTDRTAAKVSLSMVLKEATAV